jgi:hypothetical protein
MGDLATVDQYIGIPGFQLRLAPFMLEEEFTALVLLAELDDPVRFVQGLDLVAEEQLRRIEGGVQVGVRLQARGLSHVLHKCSFFIAFPGAVRGGSTAGPTGRLAPSEHVQGKEVGSRRTGTVMAAGNELYRSPTMTVAGAGTARRRPVHAARRWPHAEGEEKGARVAVRQGHAMRS